MGAYPSYIPYGTIINMCTSNTLTWFAEQLTAVEVAGKRILDVGAYDVNGSLRTVLQPLNPAAYIGIDMRPGPGVDVICAAENLIETFGPHSFDIIVSSSTLEHVRHWRAAITNIKTVCKPGGLILITAPSRWPYHAYPHDYWRYTPQDISYIFADCHIMALHEDEDEMALVYAKLQRLSHSSPPNLENYSLYSVVTGQYMLELQPRDYLTPYFAQVLWQTTLRPKIAWGWLVIKMGIRLRLLAPLRRFIQHSQLTL